MMSRLVQKLIGGDDEGGASPPPTPTFTPSLDFSDDRNSQYVALLFEDF